ncbi:MAG: hypothetical protein ACI35S_04335 [Anaeroplasma sp.]
MKIERDRISNIYNEKSRLLGNCFTVTDNNNKYFYEFLIDKNEAIIKTNNLQYIEEVVGEFRFYNKYITKFHTEDNSYFEEFEPVYSFKLPIKCLQPSQFFIDEEKLKIIDNNLSSNEIYIPVAIIDDEYVILDGHTRLYAMTLNYEKLVNVYLDNYDESISDFVYMAKEQNIRDISSMHVLSHNEYDKYWNKFCEEYFNNK